jgi:hypothetical protein
MSHVGACGSKLRHAAVHAILVQSVVYCGARAQKMVVRQQPIPDSVWDQKELESELRARGNPECQRALTCTWIQVVKAAKDSRGYPGAVFPDRECNSWKQESVGFDPPELTQRDS